MKEAGIYYFGVILYTLMCLWKFMANQRNYACKNHHHCQVINPLPTSDYYKPKRIYTGNLLCTCYSASSIMGTYGRYRVYRVLTSHIKQNPLHNNSCMLH